MLAAHTHTPRRLTAQWWLWALPVAAMAALMTATPGDDGPTLCPFALITGTACPGCGLTRAAAALVRGDMGSALSYHPLLPLVVVWLGGAWVSALARRRGRHGPLAPRLANRLLVGSGVLFLVVWGVRMATGTLPPV